MEGRSMDDMDLKQNDVDDDHGGQIEGYNGPSTSSLSSPTQGTSSKSRHQRKDGDDQLDEEDFERILSRTTARRLLSLFEAPEFVQRLRAYDEVDAGGTVTFTAQYRATPTPAVKWFKDEEEVRATERHQLDDDQSNGIIRLTIRDVTEADEGAYKCKVENGEGVASTTGYLSVAGMRPTRSRTAGRSGGVAAASSKSLAATAPCISAAASYLGPITEQKSMEEREEMELKRQPPSPLQHFIDSIRHSGKAKHAPIYYGSKDLNGMPGHSNDDDVFDGVATLPCRLTDRDTTSPLRNSHRHMSDTDDDLRSTASDDDLERRGGFQRRRLGHLQLKHRLAVDLPELRCFPAATRVSNPEEQELAVNGRTVSERQNETIVDSLWNSLGDSECQLLVVLAVAVATLAAALNAPPVWLIFVVAGLSLIHLIIHERRRANSQ